MPSREQRGALAETEMDDAQPRELCPSLPPLIHRPGAPQVGVWVRMNLGGTSYAYGSTILTGKPVKMVVDAPGDVAALCRFMLWRTSNELAGTDLRVLIGGRPVEGDCPVGNYGADKDTAIEMGLAAEPAPEQECHNRRLETQARRKFIVRIPAMMNRPSPATPATFLRGSQRMESASGDACRLAARQTVRPSLFSRGGAGPMVWWSTPAAYCGNFARARARATVQSVAS